MLKKADVLAFLLLTLVSLFAIRPLFHSGLYTAHDIWHQVARLYHYDQAIKDGQLFPMWIGQLAHGYGYPLFIFSYHFPWFVSIPLMRMGMSLFSALKAGFGLSVLISGWTFYLLTKEVTRNRIASITAASIYVWAPYHFLTLFVSAAVGTAWAFALVPLILLGIIFIFKSRSQLGIITLSVSSAALVLTHLMTIVIIAPLILIWMIMVGIETHLINQKRLLQIIRDIVASGMLALALVAFYLVPLVVYLPSINAGQMGSGFKGLYKSNLVSLKQLVYSPWGFGPITERATDGEISFQVGIAQWLAIVLLAGVIVLEIVRRFQKKPQHFSELFWLEWAVIIGFFISIALMVVQSAPIWKIIDQLYTVDYPFRLLLMSVTFGSLAIGIVISKFPNKFLNIGIGILVIMVAWYTNRNHVRVNQYTEVPLQLYIDSETTTNTFHEYSPKGHGIPQDIKGYPVAFTPRLTALQLQARNMTAVPFATFSAQNISQKTEDLSFDVELATSSAIAFRSFAFPQISLRIDDKQVPYETDAQGVLFTDLSEGKYHVDIQYRRARWVVFSTWISLLTFAGVGLWGMYLFYQHFFGLYRMKVTYRKKK